MMSQLPQRFRSLPTPMAGLALGVASLGWCLENAFPLNGWGQITGAAIATVLLCLLLVRFACHFDTLLSDLKHPVLGSIVPTFAMTLMVISKAVGLFNFDTAVGLWCFAVAVHLIALAVFTWHRLHDRVLEQMVPSWFIPPVGLAVADVSFPNAAALLPLAQALLTVALVCYAIMLPLMLYRLFFRKEIANSAKPTIAIMAAPASLSLAAYLTVVPEPNFLLAAILLGIAVFMTVAIYFAFWSLLRLQFSPGYAAFTFPMAIGATALYKSAAVLSPYALAQDYVLTLQRMAHVELAIATVVICYVLVLYLWNFRDFVRSPSS